jgi:hypothetical protein
VAVVAALVASIQVYVMRITAHNELVNQALDALGDRELREARRIVFNIGNKPVEDWTEEEIAAAERVGPYFSQLGFLIKNRYVRRKAFVEFWALRFIRAYMAMEPYVESQRKKLGTKTHWIYFEWLARYSDEYIKRKKPWWERRSWSRLRKRRIGLGNRGLDDYPPQDSLPARAARTICEEGFEKSMHAAEKPDSHVDQAALFGVTLAAILALFISEGSWAPLNVVVGAVLLSIIAGYYRLVHVGGWFDKTTKAGSFAAVVASCGSITAAYPVQQLFIRPIYMNGECRASNFSGGITDVQVAQEKCIGYYTTESLLVPFVVFFLIALVIWLLFVLRHVRRNI